MGVVLVTVLSLVVTSTQTTTSTAPNGTITIPRPDVCFSSLSHVTLSSNSKISVSQLKAGDHIKSVNYNGEVVSSPFLGWLHHDENVTTTFLDITNKTGNKII